MTDTVTPIGAAPEADLDNVDLSTPIDHSPAPTHRSRLRTALRRTVAWLPEGRVLPDAIWIRRHRGITRFALAQSLAVGVFALLRHQSAATALIDTAIVAIPALCATSTAVGRRTRTNCATVSLMFASAAFVDLANGATEAHFHFFVMLGIVAMYQDWVAFGLCVLIIAVHHALMGILAPRSVYGSSDEWQHPIRWALIHAAFILAASITHLIAWKANEEQELSDPLTRLANRTAFVEALDRRLSDESKVVSVLFVDLDNFKTINDSGGHHIGDLALRHAAQRMSNCIREGDLVARLGGDEFAVLVRGSVEHAALVGRRISAQLQTPLEVEGREVFIHASIGVADSTLAGSRDSADLLRDADLAMYLAKSSGKNQVSVYTSGVDRIVRERATLAADLRAALTGAQFEVHYQPVIADGTRLCGVEALLRWNHPTRGLVPPSEFIPLAEENGEITAIGAWVLHAALMQVSEWRQTLAGCTDLTVAVNLSAVQLRDPKLLDTVKNALAATQLPPAALILEVTETTLLRDLDSTRHRLDAIRGLGVRIAIDDFGTGYSSLSYLAKLPADEIKIDRSFITNLTQGTAPTALVRGIVDMARALDLEILAEGVELESQQEILRDLGCRLSQGYLYSKPLNPSDFADFAKDI
jgi:diguanylate cyclase